MPEPTTDEIEPWMHGAYELIEEGCQRLKAGSDSSKRRALVLFDESIEQSIKIFGSIPTALRGRELPPDKKKLSQGRFYDEKIEFLEWYLADTDQTIATPIGRIRWYHVLRNEIYHAGNGMVPETQNVVGVQRAALEVFEALFGPTAGRAARSAALGPAPRTEPEPVPARLGASSPADRMRNGRTGQVVGPWRIMRVRRTGERFLTMDAARPVAQQVRFHYGGPCRHGLSVPEVERVAFMRLGGPDDGDDGVMHAVPGCWRTIQQARRGEGVEPGLSDSSLSPASHSPRQVALVRFWTIVLEQLQPGHPIWRDIRPRPYAFLTKSVDGVTTRLNIKRKNASVWVMLTGGPVATRRRRIAALRAKSALLEAAVGAGLGWAIDVESPFVFVMASSHGLDDEERWTETAAELVDSAERLSRAVSPYL